MRKAPLMAGPFATGRVLLGAAEALEALVELLDATGRVEDALLARVERVRRRRDLDVDDGVLDAVQLDGLVAGRGRTGEEGLARTEVAENDGVVVGVDVSLHGVSLRVRKGNLRRRGTKDPFYQSYAPACDDARAA